MPSRHPVLVQWYLNLEILETKMGAKIDGTVRVMSGPSVHIYPATHSKDFMKRRVVFEYGKPVSIGDDSWIGGQACYSPGSKCLSTVYHRAGTVISEAFPDDTVVIGNTKD